MSEWKSTLASRIWRKRTLYEYYKITKIIFVLHKISLTVYIRSDKKYVTVYALDKNNKIILVDREVIAVI